MTEKTQSGAQVTEHQEIPDWLAEKLDIFEAKTSFLTMASIALSEFPSNEIKGITMDRALEGLGWMIAEMRGDLQNLRKAPV